MNPALRLFSSIFMVPVFGMFSSSFADPPTFFLFAPAAAAAAAAAAAPAPKPELPEEPTGVAVYRVSRWMRSRARSHSLILL